jgi:hypothetical protein
MIEKEEATRRKKELERTVKEKRGKEESIQCQLDKQCMNQCRNWSMPKANIRYCSLPLDPFFAQLIVFLLQTAESVPFAPPSAECAQMSHCRIPPGLFVFRLTVSHSTMSAINKAVTPWLITEYGIDWNNVDTATLLLAYAIVSQQLGRYHVSTFPEAIDRHSIKQVAFTNFILRAVGNSSALMFESDERPLTHCFMSAESNIVYRKDISNSSIKLLFRTR